MGGWRAGVWDCRTHGWSRAGCCSVSSWKAGSWGDSGAAPGELCGGRGGRRRPHDAPGSHGFHKWLCTGSKVPFATAVHMRRWSNFGTSWACRGEGRRGHAGANMSPESRRHRQGRVQSNGNSTVVFIPVFYSGFNKDYKWCLVTMNWKNLDNVNHSSSLKEKNIKKKGRNVCDQQQQVTDQDALRMTEGENIPLQWQGHVLHGLSVKSQPVHFQVLFYFDEPVQRLNVNIRFP